MNAINLEELSNRVCEGRFKKKLMEFCINGPDPASQHPEKKTKKTWSKNALNHLK